MEQLHKLDYNHFFGVLVLQGQSGGSANITVRQVKRDGDRVIVYAELVTPKPGAGQTADVTDAYQLIAIPKDGTWGQQIRFELVDNSVFGGVVATTTHSIP